MTPEEIRVQLETSQRLPEETLRQAVRHAEALVPAVVDVIERAGAGVYLLPGQQRLLFHGLYALAAGRTTAIYRPLMALLRRPEEELDLLLGDTVTETLPQIVLAVFDGDVEPLVSAIEDRTVLGWVRYGLFDALARLTFDGAVSREETIAVLDRFDRDRLADDGDAAWMGWEDVVMLLGLADRADRVRASWEDGRNPRREIDRRDWEKKFENARIDPTNPDRFAATGLMPLDDPVPALPLFLGGEESDATPASDQETPGPEDPAAGIELDSEEIDWLAGFLESAQVPQTTMSLEELDGFFTALVVGPATVLPSEYLPHLWQERGGEGPVYDSQEQLEYVIALLMRHWNAIATRLDRPYPHMPLIWGDTDGSDGRQWAHGFMRGVELRFESWQPLVEDEKYSAFFGPMMMLETDDPTLVREPPSAGDREELIEDLPLAIIGIHRYWREHRHRSLRFAPVKQRKVGRNEPCPCGSGKKYKVCCGR